MKRNILAAILALVALSAQAETALVYDGGIATLIGGATAIDEYASYSALPGLATDGDRAYTTDTRTTWEYVGTRGGCPVAMWLPHEDVQHSQGCVLTTTGSYPIYIDAVAGDTEAALAARGWTVTEAGGAVTDEAAGLQLTSDGGDATIVEITAAGTIPAHVLVVVEMATSACGSANNSCASLDIRGATKQHTLSPNQGGTLHRYGMTSSATVTISAPNFDASAYARVMLRGGDGATAADAWDTAATVYPVPRVHSLSASEAAPAATHSVRLRTGTSAGNTFVVKRLFVLETVP